MKKQTELRLCSQPYLDHPSLSLVPCPDDKTLHLEDLSSSDIRNTLTADDFSISNLIRTGNKNLINPIFVPVSGLEQSDSLVSQFDSLSTTSKSLING